MRLVVGLLLCGFIGALHFIFDIPVFLTGILILNIIANLGWITNKITKLIK